MLLEDDLLARTIGEALVARGAMLAVAETTAGGLISARLLSVAGASAWFERGVVCYSREAKLAATGVDLELLKTFGAVSVEAVSSMAEGLRALSSAEYALAESGIAGPVGKRRSAKPAGTVVIALATPAGTFVRQALLPGTRVQVMQAIAEHALAFLAEQITKA